jgi:hypothetical protein
MMACTRLVCGLPLPDALAIVQFDRLPHLDPVTKRPSIAPPNLLIIGYELKCIEERSFAHFKNYASMYVCLTDYFIPIEIPESILGGWFLKKKLPWNVLFSKVIRNDIC